MFGRNKNIIVVKKEIVKEEIEKQKLLLEEKRTEYESLKKDYDEKFEKFEKTSYLQAQILAPELDMLDEDIHRVIRFISCIQTNITKLSELLESIPGEEVNIPKITECETYTYSFPKPNNWKEQERINEKMNLYEKINSSYGGVEQVESKHMKIWERMNKKGEGVSPETQKQEEEKKRENNQG